ncbi:MAG TPA: hypothetical protein VED40_00495 [Azospirillaceae bacterium]|nr:hypothetical protein [Azospirillaceae bacterium]
MFGLLSGPNDPFRMKSLLSSQMSAADNAFFSAAKGREKPQSLSDKLKEMGIDDDRVIGAAKAFESGGRLTDAMRVQQKEITRKAAAEKMKAYQSRMKEIEGEARQAAAAGDVKKAASLAREAAKMARGLAGTAKELAEAGRDPASSDPNAAQADAQAAQAQAQADGQPLPTGYTAQGTPVAGNAAPANPLPGMPAASGSDAGQLKAYVEETRGFLARARKLVEEADRLRRLNDPDDRRARKELEAARDDLAAAEGTLRELGPVAGGEIGVAATGEGGEVVEFSYTRVTTETVTIAIEVTEQWVDIRV